MTENPGDPSNSVAPSTGLARNLVMSESRRLTGPGLLWLRPGAGLEVAYAGYAPDQIESAWRHAARKVLDAVGWHDQDLTQRHFPGGMSLAISAPIDQLYAATDVAEAAWNLAAAGLEGRQPDDFAAIIADLHARQRDEADPTLIALANAATAHGLEVLADDELVTVGHGNGSLGWHVGSLPAPGAVDWHGLHNLPLGLITGTNGKTTTTRIVLAMALEAGVQAGLTSTDRVQLGREVLERGDFSGPSGARLLLRDPRLEMGFLELARGGILRRGLPVRRAMAAVITNVASDHLGEYGITTVAELAEVKFAIRHGLCPGGVLILNADDAPVVNEAERLGLDACWFSLSPTAPQITKAKAAGKPAAWLQDEVLIHFDGQTETPVIAASAIPIAMGGAARYNIANALAAICLARAMGLEFPPISRALAKFRSDPIDNPGRCNEFARNGARIFVDFAHNPHSIAAVTSALITLPARKRYVMLAHAGDRSDEDIRDLARGAFALSPDFVVIAELSDYLRGRPEGSVSALLRAECLAQGMAPARIMEASSPLEGTELVLSQVQPGDLALLLVHSQRDEIFHLLSD